MIAAQIICMFLKLIYDQKLFFLNSGFGIYNETILFSGVGTIKLPISNPDPKSRLMDIETQLTQAQSSTLSEMRFLVNCYFGRLPHRVLKFVLRNIDARLGCGAVTALNSFQTDIYKCGLKQVQYYFIGGLMMESFSVGKFPQTKFLSQC